MEEGGKVGESGEGEIESRRNGLATGAIILDRRERNCLFLVHVFRQQLAKAKTPRPIRASSTFTIFYVLLRIYHSLIPVLIYESQPREGFFFHRP